MLFDLGVVVQVLHVVQVFDHVEQLLHSHGVVAGQWVAASSWAPAFVLTHRQLVVALAIYGFAASVLPVWMLLTPRDYLSTFMKIGTIGALIIGVIIVNPELQAPAVSQFASGGGPIIPGPLFPFVFITIACGAISGFHALIGTGTTPKMVDRETDARMIGYGAMLCEGLVAVLALIAATSMEPGDYFAINTSPEVFQTLGLQTVHLDRMSSAVGEELAGRTGGAVSLAIGMAEIFRGLPLMNELLGYWYHFAIMFEALFILTTVDTGTRVARLPMISAISASPSKIEAGTSGSTIVSPSPITAVAALWKALMAGFSGRVPSSM